MRFRHTRRSNDGHTWLASALLLAGTIFCGFFFVGSFAAADSLSAKLWACLFFGLFAISFFSCLRGLLYPYEWELVVEGDQIRWGESARPQRQQRVFFEEVRRFIHDKSDSKVLADVGGWRLIPLGEYILMRVDAQLALIEHLRQTRPNLKIETT